MNQELIFQKLTKKLGEDRVTASKDISPYFTMKTQTKAEYFFEAESKEDWINVFNAAKELNIPLFVLGGGSNIAVLHDVIPGITVRNMFQEKKILHENNEYVDLWVSSGYPLGRLVNETASAGYEGIEYHLGLPGTIGGGVAMNSKWYVNRSPIYLGDPVIKAELLDKDGKEKVVNKDYFKFAYDYSIIKDTKEIILGLVLRLKRNNPNILTQRSKEALEYRRKTQVHGQPTCGCMFQNISEEEMKEHHLPYTSAGYLIDKCGLKNTQVGAFIVSDKHANFIVNTGEGKPEDLVKLISLIKTKVKETFGIELREEVILV